MAFTIENRVGRLFEVRLEAKMTLEEVQQFRTRIWLALGGVEGRAVMVGDMLHADMFAPGVAEKIVEMLKHDNAKVERVGFILSDAAGFGRQVDRMIGDAIKAAEAAGK